MLSAQSLHALRSTLFTSHIPHRRSHIPHRTLHIAHFTLHTALFTKNTRRSLPPILRKQNRGQTHRRDSLHPSVSFASDRGVRDRVVLWGEVTQTRSSAEGGHSPCAGRVARPPPVLSLLRDEGARAVTRNQPSARTRPVTPNNSRDPSRPLPLGPSAPFVRAATCVPGAQLPQTPGAKNNRPGAIFFRCAYQFVRAEEQLTTDSRRSTQMRRGP